MAWIARLALASIAASCSDSRASSAIDMSTADPAEEFPGGATTVSLASELAFSRPLANLDLAAIDGFFIGNSLFNVNWVTAPASVESRDGLGPHFNARSCSGCHTNDGRGRPPLTADEPMVGVLLRLGQMDVGMDGVSEPDPTYGSQLQPSGVLGVIGEGRPTVSYELVRGEYDDGTPYELRRPTYRIEELGYGPLAATTSASPRSAPAVFGLGLIAAVSEADIRTWEDPDDTDGDGVRGRANWVPDRTSGGFSLGRYGWKAGQPSIAQQSAAAFVGDIGITTNLFPEESATRAQGIDLELFSGGEPELDDEQLADVVFYMQTLAPAKRRSFEDESVRRGREQFFAAGCAACHRPAYTTGEFPAVPELSDQRIYPYSDFLLHDMGAELADGVVEHSAGISDWRTPPLWGIGLFGVVNGHMLLMHDGRARGVAEAVLWHGGEGRGAREAFLALNAQERSDLVAFVEDL